MQYSKNQNISTWLTKFKYYVEINKIFKNKKECLLNALDEETLNLVKNNRYSLDDVTAYQEIIGQLKTLFKKPEAGDVLQATMIKSKFIEGIRDPILKTQLAIKSHETPNASCEEILELALNLEKILIRT